MFIETGAVILRSQPWHNFLQLPSKIASFTKNKTFPKHCYSFLANW